MDECVVECLVSFILNVNLKFSRFNTGNCCMRDTIPKKFKKILNVRIANDQRLCKKMNCTSNCPKTCFHIIM